MMSVHVTNQQMIDELRRYGFEPTPTFCDQTRTYIELLLRWNRRISLTAVRSPVDILRFHFGESLFAISATGIGDGRLADVGSGAGFPGVPLAMARPALDVTLVESSAKKAAFLGELQRGLGLKNVHVFHGRNDTLDQTEVFGYVTARGVGGYADLLEWTKMRLAPDGRLLLWLGERQVREVVGCPGWEWQDRLPIPRTKARLILLGSTKV
jgi:16S rRNA (guanine527-N7)-methyltransferase